MTRVAVALELEIPDDGNHPTFETLNLTNIAYYLAAQAGFLGGGQINQYVVRHEVHSDPDAIFQPEDER